MNLYLCNFVVIVKSEEMSLKAHQKHANLIKPQGGKYHRLEFGLIGAPCPALQKLFKQLNFYI